MDKFKVGDTVKVTYSGRSALAEVVEIKVNHTYKYLVELRTTLNAAFTKGQNFPCHHSEMELLENTTVETLFGGIENGST